jgi:hypothetical protein
MDVDDLHLIFSCQPHPAECLMPESVQVVHPGPARVPHPEKIRVAHPESARVVHHKKTPVVHPERIRGAHSEIAHVVQLEVHLFVESPDIRHSCIDPGIDDRPRLLFCAGSYSWCK